MTFAQIAPQAQALSRHDKLRLIQFLAEDLERYEVDLIPPGQNYPIWSPHDSFAAAATMLEVLAEDEAK